MYLFKDVRGFTCLNIIGSMGGTVYMALSIIWPSRKFLTNGAEEHELTVNRGRKYLRSAVNWMVGGCLALSKLLL
jgi:hypothetical protein